MELVMAVIIGALTGVAVYLLLRRSPVRLVLGIALLGNAINLLIFTAAGLSARGVPIVAEGAAALAPPHPDPLPQALVLTAIVIGFGITAFALVLLWRMHHATGVEDLDRLEEEGP